MNLDMLTLCKIELLQLKLDIRVWNSLKLKKLVKFDIEAAGEFKAVEFLFKVFMD